MARLVRELFGVPKPKGKDDLAPEADDPPWPDVKVVVIVNKRSGSRLVRPLDMPAPNASSSARARSLSGDPPSPLPLTHPLPLPRVRVNDSRANSWRCARERPSAFLRARHPSPAHPPVRRPTARACTRTARKVPSSRISPRLASRLVRHTRRVRLVPTRRVRPHTPPLPSADTPRRTAASFTSTNTFAAATRAHGEAGVPGLLAPIPRRPCIAAAGGDGTVSWVAELIHDACALVGTRNVPPIAILSLGTGNELARVTGGAPPTTDAASFPLCAT